MIRVRVVQCVCTVPPWSTIQFAVFPWPIRRSIPRFRIVSSCSCKTRLRNSSHRGKFAAEQLGKDEVLPRTNSSVLSNGTVCRHITLLWKMIRIKSVSGVWFPSRALWTLFQLHLVSLNSRWRIVISLHNCWFANFKMQSPHMESSQSPNDHNHITMYGKNLTSKSSASYKYCKCVVTYQQWGRIEEYLMLPRFS